MHVIYFYSDAGEKIGYAAIKNPTRSVVEQLLQEEGRKAAYAVFNFFGTKKITVINPLRGLDVVDSSKPSFLKDFCYII